MFTAKKQVDGVRGDYDSQEKKIIKLNSKIESLKSQLKARNDECAALQKEVEQLENLDVVEILEGQIGEKKEKIKSLQSQLTEKETELRRAKEAILDTEKKYSQAVSELKIKSDKVQQLELEVSELKFQLETWPENDQCQEANHKQHKENMDVSNSSW